MKKIKTAVSKAIVKITHKTAVQGAGLASRAGFHQPKVPEKLTK